VAVQHLVTFLLNDCCGGRTEICAPVVAALSACCASSSAATEIEEHA